MQVNITFRGMDPSDAVKRHLVKRLGQLERFFDRVCEATAVFTVDRYLHEAEITLRCGTLMLHGHAANGDLCQSIDQAVDRLESQVVRAKGRRATRRHHFAKAA